MDSQHNSRGGARPGAGRPRRAPTLAAAMRERFSVDWICDHAGKLVESAESEAVRLRALEIIAERTHGKVTERTHVTTGPSDAADDRGDEVDLSALTPAQMEEWLALEERRTAILDAATGVTLAEIVEPLALPSPSRTGAVPASRE